ncbi:MAG: hypothetical protein ACRCY3_15955 [Sphingorhabdus sp.]
MSILIRLSKIIFFYLLSTILGFAIYIFIIKSPILSEMSILFYRGVFIAILSIIILSSIISIFSRKFVFIDLSIGIGAIALSFSFNICFLVLMPVTIDRSVTMFLLSRMEAAERPLTEQQLQQIFEDEYLGNMRQINRRIKEQSITGNVRITKDGVVLTEGGKLLLKGSRKIGRWFETDKRFVNWDQP